MYEYKLLTSAGWPAEQVEAAAADGWAIHSFQRLRTPEWGNEVDVLLIREKPEVSQPAPPLRRKAASV